MKISHHIHSAKEAQSRLNDLYRETIGLIDSLKNRSKKFMKQISDIEDGLVDEIEDQKSMEKNINALTEDIDEFNKIIKSKIISFSREINSIMESYSSACNSYQAEKGELSLILEGRKRLLFLDLMIRKIRAKVNSLQQMNNILFSFSEMLKEVKLEYKNNLITLNSEFALSLEHCNMIVRKMERIN